MIQSENVNELLAALAEVQNEIPTMPKSSQAYGYKYADLDTITQTIKPILHEHGIGYMQSVGGLSADAMTLTTRVFNKAGQYIEDTAVLPTISSTKNNAAQTLGMSITYMRRYALCAMLGITSDEDTDANTNGAGANPTNTGRKPADKPTPPKNAQPQKPAQEAELKGGASTEAEKARIKELCGAKYANGAAIFSKQEIQLYCGYRKEKTAAELIAFIENALRNRRADAPELKTAQGQTAQQPTGAELAEQAAQSQNAAPSFDTMPPADNGDLPIF